MFHFSHTGSGVTLPAMRNFLKSLSLVEPAILFVLFIAGSLAGRALELPVPAPVAGIALVLLGVAAGVWVVTLQRDDAALRARGVAATATVVDVNGERRLEFATRDGRTIRAVERTKSGEQQPGLGAQVAIHYDRADPSTIVTDAAHTGRDVTLWIVAAKLVIGGAVLLVFALRRLRRA